MSDSATPRTAAHQVSLSITKSRSLLKLLSIKLVMPSNHLTLCHPILLLPSMFPSIRVFPKESVLCITWPKNWHFSISPSSEYSGLISFRIGLIFLLFNGLSQHIIPFIIIENIFCLSQEVRSSQGWMLSTRVE